MRETVNPQWLKQLSAAAAKVPHIFSAKNGSIFVDNTFEISLTNDVVSFEQLGSELLITGYQAVPISEVHCPCEGWLWLVNTLSSNIILDFSYTEIGYNVTVSDMAIACFLLPVISDGRIMNCKEGIQL